MATRGGVIYEHEEELKESLTKEEENEEHLDVPEIKEEMEMKIPLSTRRTTPN
ncbi:hypothetical protein ACLOJK_007782 [Asimina triloba]